MGSFPVRSRPERLELREAFGLLHAGRRRRNPMRKLFSILAITGGAAMADTWTGSVVDVMCKGKDLANHTKSCSVSCAAGGYGLVLSDGKFVKFNETGNSKALAAIKATTKEKDLKAKVTGTLDGEVINVTAIEIQ